MKRICVLLFLFLFPGTTCANDTMDVWTTSPWLALIARFIGGVYIEVRPVMAWKEDNVAVRLVHARDVPFGAHILCLDGDDLRELGFSFSDWKQARQLYDFLPFPPNETDSYLSDPSVLPFVAQRLLIALSEWDQMHYSYFQRRLAEFQTRLESTVIVGRKMLAGTRVVDLTGCSTQFLRAAGCVLEKPEPASLDLWSKGDGKEELLSYISEKIRTNRLPVFDDVTSTAVRGVLASIPGVARLSRPAIAQDILLSFYDRYLYLWNMTGRGKSEISSSKGKEPKR